VSDSHQVVVLSSNSPSP